MAVTRRVTFDKTEIVVGFFAGRKYRVLNLSFEDIQRIQIDPFRERKLFFVKPSERITIVTGKNGEPIVYTKLMNEPYWDDYKRGFTRFAKAHNITFADYTAVR